MTGDKRIQNSPWQGRIAVLVLILAIIAVPAVALGTDLTSNTTEPTTGVLTPGVATTPADPPAPGDENGTTVTGSTPVEVAQVDVTQTPDRVDTPDTRSRLLSAGTALQGVIPDTNNVFLKVANSAGARFNDFGNDTYNIRWTGEPAASPDIDGGQNALHITADPSQQYGQLTYTDNQSGTFWVTDTGGRQYKDEILLLVAVNGTIPDDFKIHLQADGYQWVPNPIPHTPPALEDATYNNTALDEWFTKEDFIYGPQTWRPAAHAKYPLYPNQDVYDESNTFMMMLVDLNAGDRYSLDPVRVQYTVENLSTFVAFNAYAYSKNADIGVYNITCWTNRLLGNSGEFSGYYVSGSPPMPAARVVVSPSELELPLNGKETFTATAYDELEREIKGASFVWTTTNQEVGTIDGFGHFTPKSAGETEVRATTGNVTGTAIVKVIEPMNIVLDSISISPSELILYDDDPKVYTFTATGYDQFGDLYADGVYTWSSSNETVCIVDTSGVAEILQYGNSTISAQNSTVTGKAEVTLKRRPDWNLKINGTTCININRTQFIELAEKNPASYTDNKQDLWEGVSLSSLVGLVDDSDPSVFNATIAADTYKIRVMSTLNGDATSEFTSDELLSDKTFVVGYKLNGREIPEEVTGGRHYWPLKLHGTGCQDRSIERITDIEVYIRPQILEIKISPASINVWDNSEPYKIPIQAFDSAGSVIPEEDYILNYTWDSSNPGVGTVNQSGYFSPVGIGKTTVSASRGDTRATVEIQVVSSTAGKIYVGNTSGDFKTIQSAVDFSHDGDTIVVMNGTYRENVFIDHPVTIVSENGPDAAIVERGDQNAYAFTVQASDVTISSLGINGNIILKDGKYSNLIVDSNAITDGGICLSGVTSNNTIINNSVITTSSIKGIDVKPSSNNNTICKNFVSTDMFGLFIDLSSEGHIIADNTFNTSSKCFAYNSTFSNNTFLDGGTWYTQEVLYLHGDGNFLTNNTIHATQRLHALKLTGANVVVTGNTLKGGTSKVINSDGVSNVVFCMNNLIKVNASSYFSFGSNLNSTAPVTYYYNGSEYTGYLGNFWDGFSAMDEDGNGIFDVPYAPGGCDYYPLVGPYEDGVIKAPDVMYYPVSIELAPDEITILRGESKGFTTTAFDNLGRKINGATFTWSISNESVGTVDQNGLFSAINKGNTTITASRNTPGGTVTGSANVSVIGEYPVLIELAPHNVMMLKGDSREFAARTFDGLGREVSNVTYVWSSSNESIGNVDKNGSFSATGTGDVTVIASLDTPDGMVKGSANVSVIEEPSGSMTFSVDDDLPADFSVLEDATSFARDGDTVVVRDGNYTGNIVIKRSIVLKSENGPDYTHLSTGSTINVQAGDVTIEGLSFGSLNLINVEHCVVRNNTLSGSRNDAIYIENATACIIENNSLSASENVLDLTGSTNNVVLNNRLKSARYGILVWGESKNNLISNNTIESCRYGICLNDAGVTGNKIWRNTIRSCSNYDLNIRYAAGNMFLLNNIPTTRTYVTSAKSLWNTTTPVTYLFNGVEHTGYLGNYWATYSGTDTDGDGVGDDPYAVVGSEVDSYPLVSPPDNYLILKATAITVTPASATLKVGESVNFTAELFDLRIEVTPDTGFTWTSSNETVGVVNATTGRFEALSPGSTTVTASAGGATGTAQVTVTAQTLTAIKVSPEVADLIVGGTCQFTATAEDQAGQAISGVEFTWTSSNTAVGVVNATTGDFEALSPGTTTVTASAGGVTGTAQATVTARTLTAIEVSPAAADLIVGGTRQFTATAEDQAGHAMTGVEFTWTSSNETVGTIDENGLFTALNAGDARVIAKNGSVRGTAQVSIRSDAHKIIYVDAAGSADYTSIQEALAACNDGDLIIVKDGKYQETVTVDKSVTIRSENGLASTELYPDESGFVITADGVEISGITVVRATGRGNYGIKVLGAADCRITNNRIFSCREGILLDGATGTLVENNAIEGVNSGNKAFAVINSTSGTFSRNFFKSGLITVDAASTGNRWYSDTVLCYEFNGTAYTSCLGNRYPGYSGVDTNGDGIGDEQYVITGNETDAYPLVSLPSNYRVLEAAIIDVTPAVVTLDVGGSVNFAAEVFDQRGERMPGADLTWTSSNTAVGVVNATTGNFEALSPGTTTVTASAGGATGTAQVTVNGSSGGDAPVANFTANVTSGEAPLAVAFTDASTGTPTSWAWDFENDGLVDSTEQNPAYTYTAAGIYTVNLTVMNNGGSNSAVKTDYITVTTLGMTVMPSNSNVLLRISNDGVARFNDYGNNTYHFFSPTQSASQGLNALHITTDPAESSGQVTVSSDQAGVFYLADTGGRGWDDNGILLLAVNGTIPDSFRVTVKASGYQWTPVLTGTYPTFDDVTYVPEVLNETFTKDDFLYGPQIWRPCPGANYPIFDGQDMTDAGNTFSILFIDLNAGILGANALSQPSFAGQSVTDNGAIKVEYSFENMPTFAAFDAYAYTVSSNQGQGIRWTNRLSASGSSGYAVTGQPLPEVPTADFTANVTSGEAPLAVLFTDASTGSPTSWAWDFENDGIVDSTEPSPTHLYTTAGTYTINLTVANEAGNDAEVKADYITVTGGSSGGDAPLANFTAIPTSGDAPLNVTFTDASTGTPTSWAWDFENDSIIDSTEQSPTHIYTTAGTYTVNLTVANAGGTDSEIKTDYITVTEPAGPSVLPGYNNIFVKVANDHGAKYNAFGNSTYNIRFEGIGRGLNALHISTDPAVNFGQATVSENQTGTFYATDSGGKGYEDEIILMVAVNGTIPDDFRLRITADGYTWTPNPASNQPPSLDNVTYQAGSLDEVFTKEDFIYGPQIWKPTGNEADYPIYAGQNMTDTENTFQIMFIDLNAGVLRPNEALDNQGAVRINYAFENLESFAAFSVYGYCKISNNGDDMVAWTNALTSDKAMSGYSVAGVPYTPPSAPVADFTATPLSGDAPLAVAFTDASTGTPTSWAWDFENDGTIDSTEQNPSHTYTAAGNYTVNLTVTNAAGSNSTIKADYITVTAPATFPDLTVSTLAPNCGEVFSASENTYTAKITNIGTADAGAFAVGFNVSGVAGTVAVTNGLAAGANATVTWTDETVRTAGENVTVTATADADGAIAESNEENNARTIEKTVVANGYRGKRWTGGDDLNTVKTYDVRGDLLWSAGDSAYLSAATNWIDYTVNWTAGDLAVPENATIAAARLYVPYTEDKGPVFPANVALTFNDVAVEQAAAYEDEKMWGSTYPYGMTVYDVAGQFSKDGNAAVLANAYPGGGNVSVRGMLLAVVYDDGTAAPHTVLINEGFDLLYGGASQGSTPEQATAYAPFAAVESGATGARLITVAPGAGPSEGDLLFNGETWTNVWNYAGTSQIGVDERNVTSFLAGENLAGFRSDADYMEAAAVFLVVEYPLPTGSIAVTSTPTGAAVFLDGTETGLATPITLENVPAGDHVVTLKLDGYADASVPLTVISDETATVDLTLTTLTGSLAVTSTPEGARILIDGAETGNVTNATLDGIAVGTHTVTVTKEGYRDASAEVTIAYNETAPLHLDLARAAGSIAVASTPDGARIYLNGTDTGRTTNATLENVPVGDHVVTVKKAGYADATATVTVADNETAAVSFALTAPAGSILIASSPDGAAIFLDGVDTGEVTNATLTNVPVGTHTVRVELEGYQAAEETVTVKVDEVAEAAFTLDTSAITLRPGWNFISTPKRLADGQDTVAIFDEVDTADHSVLLYDGQDYKWRALSSTAAFQPLDGIWIYANTSYTIPLTFAAGEPELPPTKDLGAGWNAIGFTDTVPESAATTLISVSDAWTTLFGFDAEMQEYDVSIIRGAAGRHGDERTMQPMQGYWIYMTTADTLAAI